MSIERQLHFLWFVSARVMDAAPTALHLKILIGGL
jgi:hypothetical protein